MPGVAFSRRRLDRRQRRRRRPAVVAVAPVRADVERWLRGHRDRRGRHLPVRRLPVQDHHRGDREQGHDDRGHHRDHHGASRWGGAVPVRTLRRGGTHADEDFRSSASSRCSGSGRGATGGLYAPSRRAQSRRDAGAGSPSGGRTERSVGVRRRVQARVGGRSPAPIRQVKRPAPRDAEDEPAGAFTLAWCHRPGRYTATADVQRADGAGTECTHGCTEHLYEHAE